MTESALAMGIRSLLESLKHAVYSRSVRERGRIRRLLGSSRLNPEIALYDLMRSDNQAAHPLYRAGPFWEEINRDFRDLIWAGALRNLRDEYFNERFASSNPLSSRNYCNIYSFAEMPRASVENYFAQIDRITAGVFYMKQRKVERNVADDCEIRADDYPVRAGWRQLYDRTSSAYESVFEKAFAIQNDAARNSER